MHNMYSTLYNMYSIMTNNNHANANKHLKMLPFKIQRSEFCRPKHMTVREPKRMKSKTNLVNPKKHKKIHQNPVETVEVGSLSDYLTYVFFILDVAGFQATVVRTLILKFCQLFWSEKNRVTF